MEPSRRCKYWILNPAEFDFGMKNKIVRVNTQVDALSCLHTGGGTVYYDTEYIRTFFLGDPDDLEGGHDLDD